MKTKAEFVDTLSFRVGGGQSFCGNFQSPATTTLEVQEEKRLPMASLADAINKVWIPCETLCPGRAAGKQGRKSGMGPNRPLRRDAAQLET